VIFMYEYLHRVLGRIIGLLFAVPLVIFALRGMLRPGLLPRLSLLFVLGGCQGLLGWYMVQSGLVDRPSVSQYRLTAHLGLAVALYGAIVWQVLRLWPWQGGSEAASARPGATLSLVLIGLVYLMILSGGLVAGTDAGYAYPTWPAMGDGLIPPGLYAATPAWKAAFEDVTTIQFNHRLFAYLLFFLVGGFALRLLFSERERRLRRLAAGLLVVLLAQLTLGISTLLSHVAVPVAAAHQGGAIALLTVLLVTAYLLRRPPGRVSGS
jgi:cytochrome c oxidase assembly protein subunit 15